MSRNWRLEIGLFPGLLFGVRSYINTHQDAHVLYFGCFDIALVLENEEVEDYEE